MNFEQQALLIRSYPKNKHRGTSLEAFLREEGIFEECQAEAEKALRSVYEQSIHKTE